MIPEIFRGNCDFRIKNAESTEALKSRDLYVAPSSSIAYKRKACLHETVAKDKMDSNVPNCLLVDDLEENLTALKSLFKGEKVNIFTAKSGIEALELMLQHDFAVSFLDMQMPIMDGFELAEIMRSNEKTKSIPIIFVTDGSSSQQRIFKGYEAGAIDFLHKPLVSQIVLAKLRIFLELYKSKKLLSEKIAKLETTEATLKKALESRDEFLSICSHELKTPLTSLKMQIQMNNRLRAKLGDEVALAPDKMEKFMAHADRSVDRIIHLVNDMLDISRVTTGRLSLHLEPINLGEFTQEVLERLKPILDIANCPVTVVLKDVMIKGDKFRIEQVLTNLLTNAAKYAPDSPVEVTVDQTEGMATLSVKDFGDGISEDDKERVFQRFERAVTPNLVSGLGLGLFISKEIIEMHEGELRLTSQVGKGSTFTISIPVMTESMN